MSVGRSARLVLTDVVVAGVLVVGRRQRAGRRVVLAARDHSETRAHALWISSMTGICKHTHTSYLVFTFTL